MEKSAMASTSTSKEAAQSSNFNSEFYNSGRVGRRNAMPDILGNHLTTSTADLPEQLSALSTDDTTNQGASTSSTTNPTSNTGSPAS